MSHMEKYREWTQNSYFDEETREELLLIGNDEREIEDRFYRELKFGTAGLRGILGSGTNRMNKYIVRKTTQGVAEYLNETPGEKRVVIGYDSRLKSEEFALETALVLAANGIKALLFKKLTPVPIVSFAIRELNAHGGVIITASHNPRQYNGYKVYGPDGAQLLPEASDHLTECISRITDFSLVKTIDEKSAGEKGLLSYLDDTMEDRFLDVIEGYGVSPHEKKNIKVVYTPLFGSGAQPVKRILHRTGFTDLIIVKEQEAPDGNFPGLEYPNPEEPEVFKVALEYAEKEDGDLIIGTDPDADRVGVLARDKTGEYRKLSGNDIGCLILYYLMNVKYKDNTDKRGFVIKTIVTTKLAFKIARSFRLNTLDVLTGFKFIAEKIHQLEDLGDQKFILAFEESYGYLIGSHARDKDAVSAVMIICEMADYYNKMNLTLPEVVEKIHGTYGFAANEIISCSFEGKEGMIKMNGIMAGLRERGFPGLKVLKQYDYLSGEVIDLQGGGTFKTDLPKSDVLYYEMEDESWLCIRPSGTEPKIKIYIEVFSMDKRASRDKLESIKEIVLSNI